MRRSGLLAASLVLTLGPVVLAQDMKPRSPEELHRLHQDPKAYVAFLEDPARDAYQKPHEVITALKLKPGEVVADIGAAGVVDRADWAGNMPSKTSGMLF